MKENMKISAALLTAGLLLSSVGGLHAGMLVDGSATGSLTANSLSIDFSQPANAAVFTTVGNSADGSYERNVKPERLLTQTFQVGSTFTLNSVYLEYESPGTYQDGNITLSIYNVADVNATTLTLGSLLVSGTFSSTSASRTAAGFTSSSSYPNSLLDFSFTGLDQVTLAATTGSAGYAVQISSDAPTGTTLFTWERNGNNYAGGNSYDTGAIASVFGSPTDFAMAITAVPEPSTMALAGMGGLAMLFALRRQSA